MGIVCSGPSKNFITQTMNGEHDVFREVVVRISDEGFTPCNLTLYEDQCISIKWNADLPSQGFNVVQVSGEDLYSVPGGYKSGDTTQAGSFKLCLRRKGNFIFASETLPDRSKTLKVQVFEKPPSEIKITGRGFEPNFISVQECDTVRWSYTNGDSAVACYLQEMEYCFKHGGLIARKSRLEVKSAYERIFHDTGLYFFSLDIPNADLWDSGKAALICVVKVTQKEREFTVNIAEEDLRPKVLSARVQDRIWLNCSSTKINGSEILSAYVYKDVSSSPLVSATLASSFGSSGIADLISHQFTEPGLYCYIYNVADTPQFRGYVVVKPKPAEHVIDIHHGHFNPALCTVKQGERVWWAFNDDENLSLYLKELERCATSKGLLARRKSSTSGCGCKKLKDQAYLMNLLGLVTHKFEDIGVFTYCLQDDSNSFSPSNYCSIIVKSNVKHHTVDVRDQGFAPGILNVHPGDWVWWQWKDTERLHNIVQVTHQRSLLIGGFRSGQPSRSSSAFGHIFTELGVVYFASNGLFNVFGAVVVTPQSQVHRLHVRAQGIQPDPLVISTNDCVSWMWLEGESFAVKKISGPEDAVGVVDALPPEGPVRRCYSRVFTKSGMYHFLCTSHHSVDEDVHGQIADSFVHTVLVDPVSYSCMVGVTADGFKPATVTIGKSQSVLWTWGRKISEQHNILHVRPPQADQPLARVRGLSAFDSGPAISSGTFFHTFDIPGTYYITSEGTDGRLCTVDVLDIATYVSLPKIPDAERDGGTVERGYKVFLECDTVDAEIFYTTNGSYPVDCNVDVLSYNKKEGIVLNEASFVVIRAVARKQGWVTSQIFTSKRFWVLELDDEVQGESSEEADKHLENVSEESDLKEQILKWHWFSCRPSISVELVCDNTFNIDITLGNAADVSWIKGFQLYLNGVSYGDWFNPQCRGLVVSGLIGGKAYHVVLVVFATQESFEPQLSNEVVISCPVQSSSGGALVSLEASTTPHSLVIVWPAQCDPRTAEIAAFSVLINGQPFGEQIIAEPGSDYCRVLFESSSEKEVYKLCVASHLSGTDLVLYSNEVEFSLPVPHEIVSALQPPNVQDDSPESSKLFDSSPARELLLVAEMSNSTSAEAEQSGIVKLSVKSVFGKLQAIPEDQQLDIIVDETEIMEDDLIKGILETTRDDESEPILAETYAETKSLNIVEGQVDALVNEPLVIVAGETSLGASPHILEQVPSDSKAVDKAYDVLVGQLDASIFRDLGEVISEQEPLAEPGNVGEETQPIIAERSDEFELEKTFDDEVEPFVAIDGQDDTSALSQLDTLDIGSSNKTREVPIQESCLATVYQQPEDDDKSEESDKSSNGSRCSQFWDQGKDQHNGEATVEDNVTPKEHEDIIDHTGSKDEEDCHATNEDFMHSRAIKESAIDCNASKDVYGKERSDAIRESAAEDRYSDESRNSKVWNQDEQHYNAGSTTDDDITYDDIVDHIVSKNEADHVASKDVFFSHAIEENADGSAADVVVTPERSEDVGDIPKSEDLPEESEGSEDGSETESESVEDHQTDVVPTEKNAQLNRVVTSIPSEQPSEGSANDADESANRNMKRDKSDAKLRSEKPEETRSMASLADNDDTSSDGKDIVKGSTTLGARRQGDESNDGHQILDAGVSYEQKCKTSHVNGPCETQTEVFRSFVNTGDLADKVCGQASVDTGKQGNSGTWLSKETWSTSNSLGSVINDEAEVNGDKLTQPTFEEADLVNDCIRPSRGNLGDDESYSLDRGCTHLKMEQNGIQGVDVSFKDNISGEPEQLLPRPLLVIKGTTPTIVTLEWEWTLLPEQIAGADIVYSVLILGSKFHSNINSTLCFNFDESPSKAMWPKQRDNLIQHAWKTTSTVIEISGLKQRCSYRLAVLGQLMPFARDSLSRMIPFTMPGPPKPPVIRVTDLKDRQITLTWKPPVSFGEASVTGYRVFMDGMAFGEDLHGEAISVSISDFEEGGEHRLRLIALTGHSVGDSKLSNTVITHCPAPPISPQIYHIDSATFGSICVAWKQAEPASGCSTDKRARCSYSVFVDGMLHGEYSLDGATDIFTDEHVYVIPDCEIGRKYTVCVKSYLNPQVTDTEYGQRVYVCGCYGDSSNVLEVFCAGPPSSPVVRVSRIDKSGVTLSWCRSREYGGVKLGGYILYVNGKWSGEILEPDQQQTKVTGFTPGNAICVQLSAITYDLPSPLPALVKQEGAELRHFPSHYEQPDSGVESSSSFLSKGSVGDTKQYVCSSGPPLVIQFSNLVRTVSSLELLKLGCRSASITWSLDDTTNRSIEPKVLTVLYWKTSAEESVHKQMVTGNPFSIVNLEPGTEYHLLLQCIAPHFNDDNYEDHPINVTQSQTISFKTGFLPGPPSNINVVTATENSIKLVWAAPMEHGIPVAAIDLNVRRNCPNVAGEDKSFQVSGKSCAFTFDCLAPKTEYNFVLRALTEDELVLVHEENAGSVAYFSAWTSGIEPAENLQLESLSPTSIYISWQPAVAYGMSSIQRYVVHYVQNKQPGKRSRGYTGQAKDAGSIFPVESESCQAEIHGLEPGTVYKIILETVASLADYSYDEDFESERSDVNSADSSALSERMPEIQRLHLSQPLLVCTTAPLESPVLLVNGFTSSRIHLSWNKPLLMIPVMDSASAVGEDPARGRVRHLKGFRVEVNGRVYARLAGNNTSITLKKCKSGMKYTCMVVAITCPEKQHCSQRKNELPDPAISDTDTDDDIAKSLSCSFEEAASNSIEVNLPRQELGVCMSARFSTNKPAGSLWDSPCSENGDEEGGVRVEWNLNDITGEERRYRLVWYENACKNKNEVVLTADASGYDIWPVSLSSVYTIYLETLDFQNNVEAVFGPLHCETPGPPSSPWIWCRTLSSFQFTLEWNEPRTYGNVSIRAYQVYLNNRRLEKLVDKSQRRLAIRCQSSSVYRVALVALGSDPQYGDSPQSNLLKLCTPVFEDGTMGHRPSGGIKRPAFDISIHVKSIGNTSISFEWTRPPDVEEAADHYIIKWSSVLKPQTQEIALPLIHASHVIDDCIPGTSHFIVVAAINACGDLVSRSEQCTVQTSAPVEQPVLQVKSCLQSAITVNWRKPTIFGDAEIHFYRLTVNDELVRELEADCSYFKFTNCKPCQQYTFYLKAVSTKYNCDSLWSDPLVVTCPGAERPLVRRIQSEQINCIRVGWERPKLRGAAKVQSYKVYYLKNQGDVITSDDVIANAVATRHGPLAWYTDEDKLAPVPPDSYYCVVLQVELSPDDCQPVYSQPIRTRAAVSPEPPLITVEVEGLEERQRLEERICALSVRRDWFLRAVHLLEGSVVVKGSRQRDLQIAKATDSLLEIDSELADALEDIKEYTRSISALIRWSRPRDDGDAIVSGYKVFVDGKLHGEPLTRSALETHVKLPVKCNAVAVQTLTDHPVGPSSLSNRVELSGHEFLPFVMFCYFDVHKRGESWPRSGCCSWDDSHSHELKQRGRTPGGRVFVPRAILARRIPCPVFNVMDVFSAVYRPLAPVDNSRVTALLFWTKWCYSSQKVLEYFLQFAEEFAVKFSFVTCCVRSEEPVTSHRQSLAGMLTERDWRKTVTSVTHTCGCYPLSQRSRSARRAVITDPDVCQLFGLVGVPTIILLDCSGYISWQGRCGCQDALSFRSFLLHALSQVTQSPCSISNCLHCELDKEDELDTGSSGVDETDESSSSHLRKPSGELSSLYQRLHGSSRKDDFFTSPRHLTPPGEFKRDHHVRPKTTGAGSRSANYNRFSGTSEQYTLYSRTYSAYGAARHNRPVSSRPSSVAARSSTRLPQSIPHASSSDLSLPVVTRQRGKRTHPLDRGLSPRMKAKISVEDFSLW